MTAIGAPFDFLAFRFRALQIMIAGVGVSSRWVEP